MPALNNYFNSSNLVYLQSTKTVDVENYNHPEPLLNATRTYRLRSLNAQDSSVPNLSPKAKDLILSLKSFLTLRENWDSYGATTPTKEIIDKAINFVRKADKKLLPLYFTNPGPNGEIFIELKSNSLRGEFFLNEDLSEDVLIYQKENLVFKESSFDKGLHQFETLFYTDEGQS